jgi:hypothetical protein
MSDDPDRPSSAPAPVRHVGVIVPAPADRETLSAERRAAIAAYNRALFEASNVDDAAASNDAAGAGASSDVDVPDDADDQCDADDADVASETDDPAGHG